VLGARGTSIRSQYPGDIEACRQLGFLEGSLGRLYGAETWSRAGLDNALEDKRHPTIFPRAETKDLQARSWQTLPQFVVCQLTILCRANVKSSLAHQIDTRDY
jgi:hypothetical protein